MIPLGDKRLKAGDEVISVAAGFPTTVTDYPERDDSGFCRC